MAQNYKTTKNLLTNGDTYNRYYGSFRGVDFSSDHTQVNENRFAYLANMYKDYQSGQGQAIETFPGFRKRFIAPETTIEGESHDYRIYGIHPFSYTDSNGTTHEEILVHAGIGLYVWDKYPASVNVEEQEYVVLGTPTTTTVNNVTINKFTIDIPFQCVLDITTLNGESLPAGSYYKPSSESSSTPFAEQKTEIASSTLVAGDTIVVSRKYVFNYANRKFSDMNLHESVSFAFNNKLYILDGANYLVYDGTLVSDATSTNTYVPTTYINIIPSGTNANIGTEYEQRNLLSPWFKHTFIGDGTTDTFYMNEQNIGSTVYVRVNGEQQEATTAYTVNATAGSITFTPDHVPSAPSVDGQANVEIQAYKIISNVTGVKTGLTTAEQGAKIISKCTLATVFDGRVFLSGNPDYPNHIFYCERNNTGYVDPTYWGILNYQQDGVSSSPITGLMVVADTLAVLKADTHEEGMVFFHTATATGNDVQPKIYPSTQGLAGVGCLGACTNFLDDPVFVSRMGLDAIGQLSVRYERAIEHRSSMVDAKLVNLDLSNAKLEEFNGYLVLLADGQIFLADSRQTFTHSSGVNQYEWYYLSDIGVYTGQTLRYTYAEAFPTVAESIENPSVSVCRTCNKAYGTCTCATPSLVTYDLCLADNVYNAAEDEYQDIRGEEADEGATVHEYEWNLSGSIYRFNFVLKTTLGTTKAYLAETDGQTTGGTFDKAVTIRTISNATENNLYFGTAGGVICSFNFDKRTDDGTIPAKYYNYDGRVIDCGCATKMDSCGIPHLTKNTVKKSTVVKTKNFTTSAAKIKVRTNRKAMEQVRRIASTRFTFDDVNFSELSFNTTDNTLFAVNEKEKKWVEKQYFVYSDEYNKPFAIYYIAYRYTIAGKYKESK